jgi:hypothetical protein
MCHGYEMRWKPENKARKKTTEADSEAVRSRTAQKKEAVSEDKVKEKELVPAE